MERLQERKTFTDGRTFSDTVFSDARTTAPRSKDKEYVQKPHAETLKAPLRRAVQLASSRNSVRARRIPAAIFPTYAGNVMRNPPADAAQKKQNSAARSPHEPRAAERAPAQRTPALWLAGGLLAVCWRLAATELDKGDEDRTPAWRGHTVCGSV
jgi:hypothetical protein